MYSMVVCIYTVILLCLGIMISMAISKDRVHLRGYHLKPKAEGYITTTYLCSLLSHVGLCGGGPERQQW